MYLVDYNNKALIEASFNGTVISLDKRYTSDEPVSVSGSIYRINFDEVILFRTENTYFFKIGSDLYNLVSEDISIRAEVSLFRYKLIVSKGSSVIRIYSYFGIWNLGKIFDPSFDLLDQIERDPFYGRFLSKVDRRWAEESLSTEYAIYKTNPFKRIQ